MEDEKPEETPLSDEEINQLARAFFDWLVKKNPFSAVPATPNPSGR